MEEGGQQPHKLIRRAFILLLQIMVTGVLLWLLFRSPEFRGGVWRMIREGDWRWVVAGLGCAGVGIAANVFRWRLFLTVQGIRVAPRRLGAIFLVGMFFNLFLPGVVGGEAVDAMYLMRENSGKRMAVVLSIVADHLSGLIALAAAAAVFAGARAGDFLSDPVTASAFTIMWVLIAGAVILVAATVVLTNERIRERMPRNFPARERIILMGACYQLYAKNWRQTLAACGVSFVVLYAYFGSFFCAGRAFGVDASLWDVFGVMPIVDVLAMIPVSISGLGVREVAIKELLGVLADVPGEQAVILSLAGFAFTVFWGLVGGVLFPFVKMSGKQSPPTGTETVSD